VIHIVVPSLGATHNLPSNPSHRSNKVPPPITPQPFSRALQGWLAMVHTHTHTFIICVCVRGAPSSYLISFCAWLASFCRVYMFVSVCVRMPPPPLNIAPLYLRIPLKEKLFSDRSLLQHYPPGGPSTPRTDPTTGIESSRCSRWKFKKERLRIDVQHAGNYEIIVYFLLVPPKKRRLFYKHYFSWILFIFFKQKYPTTFSFTSQKQQQS